MVIRIDGTPVQKQRWMSHRKDGNELPLELQNKIREMKQKGAKNKEIIMVLCVSSKSIKKYAVKG
ncbi:hypothetical protein [Methanosarcina siciliae]|uniref:hypothetical protein n=1 Tax=Methanosarcina siciliae TaxID=38027 RepID=UPI00064F8323|nr:hypothetical protein [Methanosarcina siciliae]